MMANVGLSRSASVNLQDLETACKQLLRACDHSRIHCGIYRYHVTFLAKEKLNWGPLLAGVTYKFWSVTSMTMKCRVCRPWYLGLFAPFHLFPHMVLLLCTSPCPTFCLANLLRLPGPNSPPGRPVLLPALYGTML